MKNKYIQIKEFFKLHENVLTNIYATISLIATILYTIQTALQTGQDIFSTITGIFVSIHLYLHKKK